MKEICYERGAEDNLTAVIAKVSDVIAGTNNGSVKPIFDFEESTVATARPPQEDVWIAPDNLTETATQPIQTQTPAAEDFSRQTTDSSDETAVSLPVEESNQTVSQIETAPNAELKKIKIENEPKVYKAAEAGGFGKILSSILLLLLGGIIGAVAVYLLTPNKPKPEVPQIVEQKSPNIPYSAFENNRRNVDGNPEQYLFASNGRAESAEDYYLLGRASLLTGKYPEAKKAFEEARNRLAQTSEVNSKILANEIAMALAIIHDPIAQRGCEKDINLNNASAAANVNINSNSPINAANSFGVNRGSSNK